MDGQRRIVDRGPMHPQKARVESFANYLRATGLYESVELVSSEARALDTAAGGALAKASVADASSEPSLGDLSGLFD